MRALFAPASSSGGGRARALLSRPALPTGAVFFFRVPRSATVRGAAPPTHSCAPNRCSPPKNRRALYGTHTARCTQHTGARPITAGSSVSRQSVVAASSRLVLTPTGSGSCDHIGEGAAKVAMPRAIPLKDGVYEVGRSAPADILLPIPTVSTRHALLRVGEGGQEDGNGGKGERASRVVFCGTPTRQHPTTETKQTKTQIQTTPSSTNTKRV